MPLCFSKSEIQNPKWKNLAGSLDGALIITQSRRHKPCSEIEVSYSAHSQLAFDASLLFTDCSAIATATCDLHAAPLLLFEAITLTSLHFCTWHLHSCRAVFCGVPPRCVLCAVCLWSWCVGARCCSPLWFVLCVSWGVVLCVPCPLRSVRCCAALCWCACIVLFVWFVLLLAPGAVVRCCLLCCFLWCSVVRCWVWLPMVVFLWRVFVSVSLSGRVARFLAVGVVCCGALFPCVVFRGAVLLCGAVLSWSAVILRCCLCLLFLFSFKNRCKTRKNIFPPFFFQNKTKLYAIQHTREQQEQTIYASTYMLPAVGDGLQSSLMSESGCRCWSCLQEIDRFSPRGSRLN